MSDDIDLDNEFDDFDDFNDFDDSFSEDPLNKPDNDRNPAVVAGKSALEEVKSTITSTNFVKGVVTKSLPNEYGSAISVGESVIGKGKNVYDDAITDFRKTGNQLKSTVRKAKPLYEAFLPKWLNDKIDAITTDDDDVDDGLEEIDPRTAEMATVLDDIFKRERKEELEIKKEDKKEELLKDTIENTRSNALQKILSDIRGLSLRQVQYQDDVTSRFQHKSLELDFKKYFVLKDLLEVTRASQRDSIEELKSITKNTGLPDYLKIHNMEMAGQIFKEKLFGRVHDRSTDIMMPVLDNIASKLRMKVSDFNEGIRGSLEGIEQGVEMASMATDMGVSTEELAGTLAGQSAAGMIGKKLGGFIRKHASKDDRVLAGAEIIGRTLEDRNAILEEYANTHTEGVGLFTNLQEFIKESIREVIPERAVIGSRDPSKLADATYWSIHNDLTLNEVIPGYLSRLIQSVDRITSEDPDRIIYDHMKGQFDTIESASEKLRQAAVGKSDMFDMDYYTSKIVNALDINNELSEDIKKGLQVELADRTRANKRFKPEMLLDMGAYGGILSESQIQQVQDLVRTRLNVDDTGKISKGSGTQKLYRELASNYRSLLRILPDYEEMLNFYSNTGNRDVSLRSGLITPQDGKDVINEEYVVDELKRYIGVSDDKSAVRRMDPDRTNNYRSRVRDTKRSISDVRDNNDNREDINRDSYYAQDSDMVLSRVLGKELETIVDAINANSVKGPVDAGVNTLSEILSAVNDIRLASAKSEGLIDPELIKEINGREGFIKKLVKGTVKRGWKANKSMYKFGVRMRRKFTRALGTGANVGIKAAGAVKDLVMNSRLKRAVDVHLAGDSEPVLTALKMRAGEYVDAITGDTIEKLEDIKGAVLDREGNTVITREDYLNGLYDKFGDKFKFDSAPIRDGIRSVVSKVLKVPKLFRVPYDATVDAFKFTRSVIDPLTDMYVPGEKTPRLTAEGIKRGLYYSAKTGKPIRKYSDIDGEIKTGDGEVILSVNDLSNGLVDNDGNPIKALRSKLGDILRGGYSLAKDTVSKGWGLVKSGFTTSKNIFKKGIGFVGGMVDRISDGAISKGGTLNTLERIYMLLSQWSGISIQEDMVGTKPGMVSALRNKVSEMKEKYNASKDIKDIKDTDDNDKDETLLSRLRDTISAIKLPEKPIRGSWQDILQRRKAAKEAKEKEQGSADRDTGDNKDDAGKDKPFWLTSILGAVTAISGILGKTYDSITDISSIVKTIGKAAFGKSTIDGVADLASDTPGMGASDKGKSTKPKKGGLFRKMLGVGGKGLKYAGLATLGTARFGFTAGRLLLSAVPAAVGVLTNPVVLAGAATAAVAYGGYKAYKYMKEKPTMIERVRFTQYGLGSVGDAGYTDSLFGDTMERVGMLRSLEAMVADKVVYKSGTPINIDIGKDLGPYLSIFNISSDTEFRVTQFISWFQNRFKPVYLTHRAVHDNMFKSPLSDADKHLNSDNINKYLDNTKYSGHFGTSPYNVDFSPFENVVTLGTNIVNSIIDTAKAYYGNIKSTSDKAVPKRSDARKVEGIKDKLTKIPKRVSMVGANDTKTGNVSVQDTINNAASKVGIDKANLDTIAKNASNYDPNMERSVTMDFLTTKYKGLYGIDDVKWDELMSKYGEKHGVAQGTTQYDSNAASLLMAEWLKENKDTFGSTPGEVYLSDAIGIDDTKKIMTSDPNMKLSDVIDRDDRRKLPNTILESKIQDIIDGDNTEQPSLNKKSGISNLTNIINPQRSGVPDTTEPTTVESDKFKDIDSSPSVDRTVPSKDVDAYANLGSNLYDRGMPTYTNKPKPDINRKVPDEIKNISLSMGTIVETLTQSLQCQTAILQAISDIELIVPETKAKTETSIPVKPKPVQQRNIKQRSKISLDPSTRR